MRRKRTLVIEGIERLLSRPRGAFKLGELEQACPGVSRDMVRHVPRERQERGAIRCIGRGVDADGSCRRG